MWRGSGAGVPVPDGHRQGWVGVALSLSSFVQKGVEVRAKGSFAKEYHVDGDLGGLVTTQSWLKGGGEGGGRGRRGVGIASVRAAHNSRKPTKTGPGWVEWGG